MVDLLCCFSAIRNQSDLFPLVYFFDIMVLICYFRVVFRSMECFCPEEERFAHSLEQNGTWLSHDFTIIENHFSADKTPEPPAREPLLDQTSNNLISTAGSGSAPLDNRPVAMFQSHSILVLLL